jgi:hypothetical protein
MNLRETFRQPSMQDGRSLVLDKMNDAIGSAIADTPHNPASIGPFTGAFSDPPTQAEMQAHAAYVESLRQALIR